MNGGSDLYRQITKAGTILFAVTLFDKLLAVAKEMLVAYQFGISRSLDAFNVALALPGTLLLIASGALMSAFVPLYFEWKRQYTDATADRHSLALLYCSFFFFLLLAALVYAGTPLYFRLIESFGSFDTEACSLGISLGRLLSLIIVLDGFSILLSALLHARKLFLSFQVSNSFLNISTIALLLVFRHPAVYILAWALIVGNALRITYMLAVLHRRGFSFLAKPKISGKALSRFLVVALPLTGGALLTSINLLVDLVMASGLASGSVSTLRYAHRIYEMPIALFVIVLSKSIFPFISEQAAADDYRELEKIFGRCLIVLGLLTFPLTVAVFLLSDNIIAVVYQRGAFDADAARLTSSTLVFYYAGLFFYAYTYINGAFFSALKNTKPLLVIGGVSVVLNIVFNLVFMQLFGVRGIALSTTMTLAVTFLCFVGILKKQLQLSFSGTLVNNLLRIAAAAISMTLVGIPVKISLLSAGCTDFTVCLAAGLSMLCVFCAVLWILRTDELMLYIKMIKKSVKPGSSE